MRYLKILILFTTFLFSSQVKELKPDFSLIADGGVTELMYKDNKLYASTVNSSLDIFDLNKKEKVSSIKVERIKDFMGDTIEAKMYSFDILDDKILLLSQGNKGGRNINIFSNNHLENIISEKEKLYIAKAKFIDKNTIIFALLSNELYLYNLKEKKAEKIIQVSHSHFSNFVLSEDKRFIIVSDESGVLKVLNTKDLKIEKKFAKQNLDNVYQVDSKNNYIITAGQDRKSAIYHMEKNIAYHKKAPFLVYSVGLSPKGLIGAFATNEENDVLVFDTQTKEDLFILKENPSLITDILFINENEVFIANEQEKINYYNLKDK